MRRKSLKWTFWSLIGLLAIFSGTQIVLSFMDLLRAGSNLIQLTFVEPENNQEIRQHPYYTLCPIFEWTANLSDTNITLTQTLVNNSRYFPPSLFVELLNSPVLDVEQFSTWVKMKDVNKDRQDTLVHCTTFSIRNTITIGKNEAKINLILFGKEPTDVNVCEPTVKEFRIYIHENLGYINTFLLQGQQPHIIAPGYDKIVEAVKSQILVYKIKKRKKENYPNAACDQTPTDDCFEKHLQSQLGTCKIPWKLPNQESPCPPCEWDKDFANASCIDIDIGSSIGSDLMTGIPNICNQQNGFDGCQSPERSVCIVCDPRCTPFKVESFCSNRSSLQTILEEMPLPSERHILHQKSSGCKLPCSYFEYEAIKIGDTSLAQEFAPHMDRACLLTLELSTGDVETDFEVPAYSVGGFIGNVAGNLGMIFGMSLYAIPFATITSYDSSSEWDWKKEMSQLLLLSSAFTWTLTNYVKYNQSRIRQEVLYHETEEALELPFITLCPFYEDSFLRPIKGFENQQLTFEKYTLTMERNFLLKNFTYKGTWGTKWNFWRHNFFQTQVYAQQCYTYKPGSQEASEIVIQLNRKGIEELRGYFHKHDSLQQAFLHKSSEPKFSIPYDNPLYKGLPNRYSYKVISRSVEESRDPNCIKDNSENRGETFSDCYVKHLEELLGCTLPWDGSRNESCLKCQLPFVYQGKEYTACSDVDAASAWCATAITMDRKVSDRSWQFCNTSLNLCEPTTCKSRETLELLVEKILDLSRTNPRIIAEELYRVGCPFNCHYHEYSVVMTQKKQDLSLMQGNILELKFELQGNSRSSAENVKKDLDYSIDMFISDLGNGFGFLLGLSLLGVIRIFINSVASFVSTTFYGPNNFKSKWVVLKSIFSVIKWTLVAVFVTYLTVSSFATDVSEIISLQLSSYSESVTTAESLFLTTNSSKEKLKWGFQSDIKSNSSCPYASEMADGFCDDKANFQECLFDGGDCCGPVAARKPNRHWFCTNCSCHSGDNNDSLILKSGMCELCLFPFVNENFHEAVRDHSEPLLPTTETAHDCSVVPFWFGKHYCPTAIHEETLKPYGIPYQWPCPQEEYELHPSCFVDPENEWRCNTSLLPAKATSSSIHSNGTEGHNLPQYAIAGPLENIDSFKHFFVSEKEHRPWLQLQFATNVTVHRVAITNKYDHRWGRFLSLTVSVGSTPARYNVLSENPTCANYEGPSAPSTSIVLKCAEPLTGVYLIIQQDTPNANISLIINEVYVCGN